ncbi:protein-tyrosine phosphatase-like protein [Roridomyces roridus]|uniref:protein-tyrosine-phosphatase n=1 Tax=Roridomyces roridus TaxID=1738132 RepID=A0AAD7CMU8_9AGAR|nr:protein-tyrosine phosphatase-like protein [Roridomyces roridus]
MITFDSVSSAEMEAMCTPMHRILSPGPITTTCKPTGALYLGSMAAMHDRDLLHEHHITHLVQVLEVPWLPQEDEAAAVFSYHRIDLEDRTSATLRPHLAAACDFIQAALGRGENVLVHCQQGVSRSASIVIAYLIRQHAMSYDSAFALVKTRRACIHPNSGFVAALRDWEAACTLRSPILVPTPKVASRYMRDRFTHEPQEIRVSKSASG